MSILVVALAGLALAGCVSGPYSSRNVFPANIASIAVPIFENQTLHTGVEREITDALIKEIQLRTPYRVIGSDAADTVLIGKVVRVEKDLLSEQRGSGLAQEVLYSITVDFEWTDQRSGETLTERIGFEAGELYIPTRTVGERPELAQFRAAEELARDIVGAMRDEW